MFTHERPTSLRGNSSERHGSNDNKDKSELGQNVNSGYNQVVFIREMRKMGPPYAPVTPKRNDPFGQLSSLSSPAKKLQVGQAAGGHGAASSVGDYTMPRSPSELLQLKIRSSKAFPNAEQRHLGDIIQ